MMLQDYPCPYSAFRIKKLGNEVHPPYIINSLNAELNPICHLLALLEAHHILHISRI